MINTNEESKNVWDENAEFWDNFMGDESNLFHRELVRPFTEVLLDVQSGELILDIACGNGNFSERLVSNNVTVIALDYSERMICLAKKRRLKSIDKIEFNVCDVTSYEQIVNVANGRIFDKAVANMALMDISDIKPLFRALSELIKTEGVFVFSMHHPCFTSPSKDYLSEQTYKGIAIEGQPMLQNYYHRPMQELFNVAFENGFCVDGFHEVPFDGEEQPIITIIRVRKR